MKSTFKFLSFAAILAVAVSPAARADEVTNSSLTQGPGVYFGTGNSNSGFDVVTKRRPSRNVGFCILGEHRERPVERLYLQPQNHRQYHSRHYHW
jgi:hypothetical protein